MNIFAKKSVKTENTSNLYVHNADQLKDYNKIGFWQRLRLKVFSTRFLGQLVWKIFRFVLLVGISYIIIYPFFTKISSSFFSQSDFIDSTVKMIPKSPTLDTYKNIIIENDYFEALFNTALLSVLTAVLQTLICAFVGYGLAKFKFKGRGLVFAFVVLTMVIPNKTLMFSTFMKFKYFDFLGISNLLNSIFHYSKNANGGIDLINTFWPLALLSLTGIAFKNGLYIFIFRQFYKGVPDELEEAAYVDGSGVFKTYFRIILPLTVPMMVTIFMFAFSWQWTDTYYSGLFFTTTSPIKLLPKIIEVPATMNTSFAAKDLYESAILNTAGLLVVLPLFVVFLFAQNALVEGIERSGIVG